MKPAYHGVGDVPKEVVERTLAELNEAVGPEGREKAVERMYGREVLLEQELATSEEPIKIRELMA
jgi:hypothetical protein